jgi:hypothetical protein
MSDLAWSNDGTRPAPGPDLLAQIVVPGGAILEASGRDSRQTAVDGGPDMRRGVGPIVAMAPQVAAPRAMAEILAALNGEPTPGGP